MRKNRSSGSATNLQDTKTTHSRTLVVAGMGRSGTSLAANWLARCGLDVGDNLLMGRPGNPAGHFEDLAFLSLHKDILSHSGVGNRVTPRQRLEIKQQHYERARDLIHSKPRDGQWGWKDPRTTLFLDFWKCLLPQVKVLGVYRPYPEVVRSLLRGDHRRWSQGRELPKYSLRRPLAAASHSLANASRVRHYLQVWERYNNDLLHFARANPSDLVLVKLDDLIHESVPLVKHINHRWGFSLHPVDAREVFKPELMHHHAGPWASRYMSRLRPSIAGIWTELEQRRSRDMAAVSVTELGTDDG